MSEVPFVENIPSNSNKSKDNQSLKEQRPKRECVVKGESKDYKESRLKKVFNAFVTQDIPDIKDYIVYDVLLPSIRDGIVDASISIITAIFGGGRRRNSRLGDIKSYDKYYGSSRIYKIGGRTEERSSLDYDPELNKYEVKRRVYSDRVDVEDIIDAMTQDFVENEGNVSVAEYYAHAGITGDFTDWSYGWTDLSKIRAIWCGNGWTIELSRPERIRERR